MKKLTFLFTVLVLCLALPVLAQEKETTKVDKPEMAPPQPLDKDWAIWMVGEWEGHSESPMGKAVEWEKVELGLNGQFLFMQATSKAEGMDYEGIGVLTVDPKTGEYVGYWVDNFRGMYQGKGKLEGDKLMMMWKGTQGKSKRITQKVDDNKYIVKVKAESPDGKKMEAKTVMTRKKSN
jgi:hypothetical protein